MGALADAPCACGARHPHRHRGAYAADTPPAAEVIDVEGASDALDGAKAELHAAIALEMATKTERAAAIGLTVVRFDVTPGMVAPLEALYRYGLTSAMHEARALGVGDLASPLAFADASASVPRLRRVIFSLRAMLNTLQARTARDLRARADRPTDGIGDIVRGVAIRRLREYPGALDAASRLVSPAYTAGLDDLYAANEQLFGGWVYTSVLDGGTCPPCASRNGEVYRTLEAAYRVMPGFGPNPSCRGGGRCRCRLAALPPGAA